jgi:hypothetical protein
MRWLVRRRGAGAARVAPAAGHGGESEHEQRAVRDRMIHGRAKLSR